MSILNFNKKKESSYNIFNNNYIIYGNDIFLKEENTFNIIKLAKQNNFFNTLEIIINDNFKFKIIKNYIKENDLFAKKKILIININKKYHKLFSIKINKLFDLLNKNILLIIKIDRFNYIDHLLFKKNKISLNLINCNTPISKQLEKWIKNRIKYSSLNLNKKIIKLLCYYYEGNMLELNQILNIIFIISLTKKSNVSYIPKIISDQAYFKPSQFSESVLLGNYKRSMHILKQLFKNKYTPITLIRFLQNDLLILINLKRFQNNIKNIFSKKDYFIYQIRKTFFNKIIKLLNEKQINLLLKLLIKIELMIYKENNEKIIWLNMKILSTFLMYNK